MDKVLDIRASWTRFQGSAVTLFKKCSCKHILQRAKKELKSRKLMPRMHSPAVQCCLCIVGLFMFLGGLIMMSTGIVLILNYDVFDVNLLPPDMQSEDGKRTVGIILTTFGLLGIAVSVLVSALYLCTRHKPSSIDPDDISRIPSSARNSTPDRPNGVPLDRRVDRERDRRSSGDRDREMKTSGARPKNTHTKEKLPPGSAEVKINRHHYKKGRHRHKQAKFTGRTRLEEIKEADAISRRTMGASQPDIREYSDSLRSGSFSSEQTFDDKTPRIVIGLASSYDVGRPESVDSTSTSMTSDASKSVDQDRTRRESSDTNNWEFNQGSTDNVSFTKEDNSYIVAYRNKLEGIDNLGADRVSTEDISGPKDGDSAEAESTVSLDRDSYDSSQLSEEKMRQKQQQVVVSDSESSVVSYKRSHKTETRGLQTSGRVTPQIGEPESLVEVEPQGPVLDDSIFNTSTTPLVTSSNPAGVSPTGDEGFYPQQVPKRREEGVPDYYVDSSGYDGDLL